MSSTPTSPRRQGHEPYRIAVLAQLTTIGAVVSAVMALAMWQLGYGPMTVLSISGLVVAAAWITRVVRSGSRSVPAHVGAFAAYIGMLVLISLSLGGLTAGVTPWIAIGPVLTLAYGERRVVVASLVLTCAAAAGLAVFAMVQHQPERILHPAQVALQAGSLIAAALYAYRASLDQDRMRAAALARVREANARLTEELEEHRRTRAELQQTTDQLVTTARAAGMAEIATGVLHNLGNALNSVNVSVALSQQHLKDDVPARLRRLAERMHEVDPAAAREYLLAVASSHEQARGALISEAEAIRERMDHAAAIVQAQQVYARSSGLVSEVAIEEVVAQAVALVPGLAGTFVHIDIVIQDTTPRVRTERHKLLQVLANLVANARDAVRRTTAPRITVRAEPTGDGVTIQVTDNGAGIAPDDVPQLFAHGFTTKADGNGFGLHASALAARELGGSLRAASDGVGRGATFTLELPNEPPERRT